MCGNTHFECCTLISINKINKLWDNEEIHNQLQKGAQHI